MEKHENKRALDEYTNLIEKQEKDRILCLQNNLNKVNNNFDQQIIKAKKKDEVFKDYEEKRFMKEKEEIEKK